MSIFRSIASAIFGKKTPGATPLAPGAPGAPGAPAKPAAQGTATVGGAPATGKEMTQAEVEGMIRKIADGQSEKLDWQRSIVDLMKLLKLELEPHRPQAACAGARLQGQPRRLGRHEYLAAQAGHGQACRERRRRAGKPQSRLRSTHPSPSPVRTARGSRLNLLLALISPDWGELELRAGGGAQLFAYVIEQHGRDTHGA